MNSRERFLTALSLKQPDKVPIHEFLFSPPLFEAVLGSKPKTYDAVEAVECALRLELDAVWIPVGGYGGYSPEYIDENTYIDEWGTTYKHNDMSWPIDAPCDYPIKTREDFMNWVAPNPNDPERIRPLQDALKYNNGRIALLAGVLGPFTAATMLMGLEEMSVALYTDPNLVVDIIKEGAKFSTVAGLSLIKAGADAIVIGDDLGYTNSLLISPQMMRMYVLPIIKGMVQEFKKHGGKVILHCDGNINEILADVVDLGIDGLHPLERKAHMNIKTIKDHFGKKVCLFGNVNTSSTLPYGTKEEIEQEVKECLRVAASGGGYVIGSDHSFSQGIPVENALYMLETINKYRNYPIKI